MVRIISPDGNQLLKRCVLAFDKFASCRYPVNLRKWVYTSKYDSVLHNHDFRSCGIAQTDAISIRWVIRFMNAAKAL